MLASGGALLLHDGGYRDFMPSGPYGAYRQDYFHNRLCVRPEKIFMGQAEGQWRYSVRDAVAGQGVLEFLRNAGSYRPVRTQKVDFLSLPDFDYSRTRLIDSGWGFQSDRVIVYVKDPEMFVVFDIFKARTEDYFTLANLWHTRKIVADGEHWYDTVYDRMRNEELPQGRQLLIYFPHTHFRLGGAEPERRHYQNEILIHQTTAHHFELGETEAFVTVLVPHDASVDPEQLVRGIRLAEVLPDRAGIGVVINAGHAEITVGVKCDLRMDMARDWRRPRYTYEAGKLSFGPLQSNGDFLFARRQGGELSYTIVNLTRALYGDRVLFETKESFFGLAFDASPDSPGAGKVRYWRDVVEIADEQ